MDAGSRPPLTPQSTATWPLAPTPADRPSIRPNSPPGGPRGLRADAACLAVLLLVILLIVWNRSVYHAWETRHDLMTQFLPWGTLLGQFLRGGLVPGWNPYQFSGTGFAGDPQSGWMSFTSMVSFTTFSDPFAAFRFKIGLELAIAAYSAYGLARYLGIGPLGAMTGAIVFAFGPISYFEVHCCMVRLMSIWIPTALLGVAVAFQGVSWQTRMAGVATAAFGVSQMYAVFLGQGALDGSLLVGAWIVYQGLTRTASRPPRVLARLRETVLLGAAIMVSGVLLNLAALWPRLELNGQTPLAGGSYDEVGGYSNPPYDAAGFFRRLIVDSYDNRGQTLAAGALILIALAPFIAWRRFGVSFWLGASLVIGSLAADFRPTVAVFSLIPMWRDLYDHFASQVLTVMWLCPAMLAAAAMDRIQTFRGQLGRAPLVFAPLVVLLAIYAWCASRGITITPTPVIAAALVTALLWALTDGRLASWSRWRGHGDRVIPVLIAAVVLIQPMGLELVDGALGRPFFTRGWDFYLRPSPEDQDTARIAYETTGPGGAATFLQQRQAEEGAFRYLGYDGIDYPDDPTRDGSFPGRRLQPNVLAVLANGRSIPLELYDIQGYNPVILSRYVDFLVALNGNGQDYHYATIKPRDGNTDLLDLLNVGYVVIDSTLPRDRDDVVTLTTGRTEVYRDDLVTIYRNDRSLGPAWLTHSVIALDRESVADRIADPAFAPATTAFIEGDAPPTQPLPAGATESVAMTSFGANRITYRATTPTDGFLVMSEIYEHGWNAYLDGDEVDLLPTDLALRGIALPAGDHTVELRYEPRSLRLGLVVSVIGHVAVLAILGLAAVNGIGRHRRASAVRTTGGHGPRPLGVVASAARRLGSMARNAPRQPPGG